MHLRSGAVLAKPLERRLVLWLGSLAGLRDSRLRRHPTVAREVWREEVGWMTLYFSVGVWTSLAMVLLDWGHLAS